jgi:uncharacterized protein YuzB (UPF0349 family)
MNRKINRLGGDIMAEIKFCENNFIHGTDEMVKKLKANFEENKVTIESCLGYCGDCAEGPYALVNDEFVQADSADELYDKITKLI